MKIKRPAPYEHGLYFGELATKYRAKNKEAGHERFYHSCGTRCTQELDSDCNDKTDGAMEVRHFGRIGGTMDALDRAVRKLVSRGSTLRFVYEAGPCGYEIYRHLTGKGFSCKVIAPSKTPKKSGDRIKNDRRDAETLARLERAGELTAIYVLREEDEAMRDLTWAREDAVKAQTPARHQLNAFLLRYGQRYPGKASWTPSHLRWLSDVTLPHPSQQIVLQEYINTVTVCTERTTRLIFRLRSSFRTGVCFLWSGLFRPCGAWPRLWRRRPWRRSAI